VTIKSSVFSAEFVAMKHSIKMLRGLRYKIHMMGIPLSRLTYVYGDNKSQVTNLSRPESTLKKKCNSICYHAIRESVAMGETLFTQIRTGQNLADFLTKTISGTKRGKLVRGVIHDIYDDFQQQAYKIIRLTHVTQMTLRKLKEYAQAEGVSVGFGVDSESASDLSRGIGVSETTECWEKVPCTSARPHVDLVPGVNGTGTRPMCADT
jgi:hypothetical protein